MRTALQSLLLSVAALAIGCGGSSEPVSVEPTPELKKEAEELDRKIEEQEKQHAQQQEEEANRE